MQTSDRKQIKKPHSNHLSNHKESKTKSRIDNKRIQKPKSKSNSISSNAQKTLVHSSSEKSCSIAINKEILECKFQRKKVNEIYRLTKAGVNKSKMNQDSSFIYQKFEDCVDHYYLGVCDGHGTYGAEISGFISEMLPIVLNKDLIKRRKLSRISGQEYNRIIEEAFLLVNDKILYDFDVDVNLSGSTCSSLIYTPDKVISANVGDSRCVIGKYFNGCKNHINIF